MAADIADDGVAMAIDAAMAEVDVAMAQAAGVAMAEDDMAGVTGEGMALVLKLLPMPPALKSSLE